VTAELPAVDPRRIVASPRSEAAAAAGGENVPAILVTIGTVEIRAFTPAAPAPPAPAPAPAPTPAPRISLDYYLKQSTGTRR